MIPKFKASCLLFGLALVLSISALFGLMAHKLYLDVDEIGKDNTTKIINSTVVICLAAASVCLWGGCLMCCDITHICCVLLYVLALTAGIPTLTGVYLVRLKALEESSNEYNESVLEKDIVSNWNRNGHKYLEQTEIDEECCGIFGPLDYRKFIYGSRCKTEKFDVPLSCCNITTLLAAKQQNRGMCEGYFKVLFRIKNLVNLLPPGSTLSRIETLCLYANSSTVEVKQEYKNLVYNRGCLKNMMEHKDNVVIGSRTIMCLAIVLAVVLLVLFLRNWSRSALYNSLFPRSLNPSPSQETIVIHDIPSMRRNIPVRTKE